MNITYLGHSCFVIEKDEFKIVIDPYENGSVPGYSDINEEADLVLCSHEHFDHNARDVVKLREGKKNPFTITEISTFHDECHGEKRGPNTIYIIDDGVNKVAHLGDLGCDINVDMSEEDRAKLTGLDAILVPIGGFYTIDAKQAAELINQLNPRIAIPMHFRSVKFKFGFDNITTDDYFASVFSEFGPVMTKNNSLIDTEEIHLTKVIILRAKNAMA